MNTLTNVNMTDPNGRVSGCIQFTIDTPADPFVLNDVATEGREYTFSVWLMSDSDSAAFTAAGETFNASTVWAKHFVTFTADSANLQFVFGAAGTYYLYHPQLEIGNVPTDWAPAPEDQSEEMNARFSVESNRITAQFNLLTQTVDELGQTVENKYSKTITEDVNGISITDSEGIYEIQIDNRNGVTIRKDGEIRSQLIDDDFYTGNIHVEVNERARFGNFAFVPRSDGSLSFLKVGG